ncbi:MAG: hypothetical protein IH993_09840 [Proteobacteria bacterium]|nr:hypothetical protein [Pseudomonadota bacterium]
MSGALSKEDRLRLEELFERAADRFADCRLPGDVVDVKLLQIGCGKCRHDVVLIHQSDVTRTPETGSHITARIEL